MLRMLMAGAPLAFPRGWQAWTTRPEAPEFDCAVKGWGDAVKGWDAIVLATMRRHLQEETFEKRKLRHSHWKALQVVPR